jgi:hypothetical protein
MDKADLVLDVLKELREDQKDHRKEMQEHQKESINWHAKAESRLSNIEEDLREHKEGVIQNRKSISNLDKRASKLEQPLTVRSVVKWVVSTGALAGAIITIMKLIGG